MCRLHDARFSAFPTGIGGRLECGRCLGKDTLWRHNGRVSSVVIPRLREIGGDIRNVLRTMRCWCGRTIRVGRWGGTCVLQIELEDQGRWDLQSVLHRA